MSKYVEVVENRKPDRIVFKQTDLSGTLQKEGVKDAKFITPNPKDFDKTIENIGAIPYVSRRYENGSEIYIEFDWTLDLNIDNDEYVATGTGHTDLDTTGDTRIDSILNQVFDLIEERDLFQMTLTNDGTFLENSEISEPVINNDNCNQLYEYFVRKNGKTIGVSSAFHKRGNLELQFDMSKLGDTAIIIVSRIVPVEAEINAIISPEMATRLSMMNSGVISVNIDRNMKMDYVIKMLSNYDENMVKLSVQMGACLNSSYDEKVSSVNSTNVLSIVLKSHYKYIFVNMSEMTLTLDQIMSLIYSGKFVILGFESDGIYNTLISLINLSDEKSLMLNKLLTSTVGFIYPKLTYRKGKYSMEETQVVTLNSTRLQSLTGGDLSREKFMDYVTFPCRTFSLKGGISEAVSQQDELNDLLLLSIKQKASDVHLVIGKCPMFRINQKMYPINKDLTLTPVIMNQIVSVLVSSELGWAHLRERKELGVSYAVRGVGRFRVQISVQRGTYCVFFRHTPFQVPSAEDLRLPKRLLDVILESPQGLFLTTGATGMGKSTTNACLVDALSKHDSYSITTISDPIEYLYQHNKSVVTQREIPYDIPTYTDAITTTFRMNPDIIEVTEMRDADSINALARFALSGHLVLSSTHTSSILTTIEAIVKMVGPEMRDELMTTFSQALVAIVNQILIVNKEGKMIAVFEYLVPDKLTRTYIEEGKQELLMSAMKTSARSDKQLGTWMDFELCQLFIDGEIDQQTLDSNLRDKNAYNEYTGNYA